MLTRIKPSSSRGKNPRGTFIRLTPLNPTRPMNITVAIATLRTLIETILAYESVTSPKKLLNFSNNQFFWFSLGRNIIEQRAGLRVRAFTALRRTVTAMVRENCLKSSPVIPPRKAGGRKTAMSTHVIPTMAPVISFMARMAASLDDSPNSVMLRSTFSTTTIASSTTKPMARTSPNKVIMLIENPNRDITANVPIIDTGIVITGMIVARQF